MSRLVQNVTFAAPCLAPLWLKPNRSRGTKALGLAYERALARSVPSAYRGQWWHYIADGQPGWCQTDFHFMGRKRIVVLEAKLTDYDGAMEQLLGLYLPVLRVAYPSREISGVVVLKSLRQIMPGVAVADSLAQAMRWVEAGGSPPVVHWLGKGPI